MIQRFDAWRRRIFPDTTLLVLGGIVLGASLIVYLLTVQRSLSFWDCGEFIACSSVLGVPHPPGTPLYVMIGRIFSILPLADDISLRINLISPLTGAAAATVAFFVLARLITLCYGDEYPSRTLSFAQRLSVYAGSFSGALLFAFGSTNWANAVEAEVYSLSMFMIVTLVWLTLIWARKRDDPASERYLVAISFLAFLSIGVHMTVFLVMPPIFLTIILLSQSLRRNWRFWLTGVLLAVVMTGVMSFLWSITIWIAILGFTAARGRWGTLPGLWTAIVWGGGLLSALIMGAEFVRPAGSVIPQLQGDVWPIFVAALVWGLGILPWTQHSAQQRLSFLMLVAALLGYSVHAYIPIRAQHDPAINENAPKTWVAFRGFLERKQYGSQSMASRALTRRGEWSNQLGQHRRMGFWGFFDRQYGFEDTAFIPVFILGLIGVFHLLWRRKVFGLLFLLLLLLSSVGLVWYMNFADGTRYNPLIQDAYLEVRNRDYFFTPAFVLFAMAIGMGGAVLVRWLAGRNGKGSIVWPVIGALLVAAMPVRALQANYFRNDRSNNYLPYDYAYNILMSADQDAILFTNGDNDTFPVWCLQEVYGIRRDVRIANLSLLNTHWYIKQLKHFYDVPMDLSDDEINKLIHYRTQDNVVHRVQDQMIDVILSSNRRRWPINFAVTVTPSNRRYRGESLEDHLVMVGMAYRLVARQGVSMVDLDLLRTRVDSVYQYRGVNDPSVYKGETGDRMIQNYSTGFFVIADTLRKAGQMEEAETYIRRAVNMFPWQWQGYVYLAQLYQDMKKPDGLDSILVWSRNMAADRERVVLNVGYSFRRLEANDRAEEVIAGLYEERPDDESVFRALAQFYYDMGRYDTLVPLIESWTERHPGDQEIDDLLTRVRDLASQSVELELSADTAAAQSP